MPFETLALFACARLCIKVCPLVGEGSELRLCGIRILRCKAQNWLHSGLALLLWSCRISPSLQSLRILSNFRCRTWFHSVCVWFYVARGFDWFVSKFPKVLVVDFVGWSILWVVIFQDSSFFLWEFFGYFPHVCRFKILGFMIFCSRSDCCCSLLFACLRTPSCSLGLCISLVFWSLWSLLGEFSIWLAGYMVCYWTTALRFL